MVANVNSLLQCFHAERVFFDVFHPEKVSRRARSQNQIIVMNFAVICDDNVALLVNALRLRHEQIDVGAVAEKGTNRVSYLARLQNGSRHLIQKRLKQMEVVAVNQSHFDVFFGEKLTDFDAAEAAANDYDSGFAVRHNWKPPKICGENFNLTG